MKIKDLAAMDDATLMKTLQIDKKIESARKGIAEMDALTGKAREYAEKRVERMFEPHIYPEDMSYIADDAKRATKTGKEESADCCCTSVMPMVD